MDKLKSCPFCGAKPRLRCLYDRDGRKSYQVYCPSAPVNIRTFFFFSENEAIKVWNKERKIRCAVSQHY